MRHFFLFVFLFTTTALFAQTKAFTLEDIWQNYTFLGERVSGFNFLQDGRSFTRLEQNQINKYDLKTGNRTGVLLKAVDLPEEEGFAGRIDSYTFSADEKKLLLSNQSEQLFRRSSQSYFFVYDLETKELTPVYPEKKHRLATLDPTGQRVAFVVDNNVWVKELVSGALTQVTKDGKTNEIINGAADWVYEEEFSFSRAIHWSPDGSYLAYLKFDETKVLEFTYTDFHNDMYPEYNTFKYPKVGEENSTVSLHAYAVSSGKTKDLLTVNNSSEDKWHYLPRVQWTTEGDQLTAQRMNRHQNELELLLFDLGEDHQSTLLQESNKYYVDVHDNLTFLEGGKEFIWTSEESGFNHVYLYDMAKGEPVQITSGDWEVTNFYGLHDGRVYFQAAKNSPMRREIYTKSLRGRDLPRPLAAEPGVSSAQFSDTYDYFVLTHSTINQPNQVTVMNGKGEPVRMIVDNMDLQKKLSRRNFQPVEFFDFTTDEGTTLNGYMIKPANMETSKEYPLLMHVYGGPGSQQVMDNWRGQNMAWFQLLVQHGFVVAVVDNRGTGARGEEMKKQTYLELGKQETEDQIAAAKYLGKLDYIDAEKIGIFGWSYGGFMALHCILQGSDVFAAAISVAPVTNWKWYDTIYTERYMRTYAENKDGYDKNSPIHYADKLKGDLLLVHGMGDDNVHFQHTAEMANALIMNNKQFDTYFYPNRNHGIYGGPTRLHLYTKMTDFLLESIGPTAAASMGELEIIPGDN
ncbi:MAG: S9 family peptidase [Bacteroidota bacterium]